VVNIPSTGQKRDTECRHVVRWAIIGYRTEVVVCQNMSKATVQRTAIKPMQWRVCGKCQSINDKGHGPPTPDHGGLKPKRTEFWVISQASI